MFYKQFHSVGCVDMWDEWLEAHPKFAGKAFDPVMTLIRKAESSEDLNDAALLWVHSKVPPAKYQEVVTERVPKRIRRRAGLRFEHDEGEGKEPVDSQK